MKTKFTFLAVCAVFIASCSKSSDPIVDAIDEKEDSKFEDIEVTEIKPDRNDVAAGQYVWISSSITGGNPDDINFAWDVSYKGTSIAGIKSQEGDRVNWRTRNSGEHIITLKATSDGKTASKSVKFMVKEADFGVGVWGNDESVIVEAETKAGYSPPTGLTGYPNPFEGMEGVEKTQFVKDDEYLFTYFFIDGKLAGGSWAKTWKNVDKENNWYRYFLQKEHEISERVREESTHELIWKASNESKDHYMTSDLMKGEAMAKGFMHVKSTWITESSIIEFLARPSAPNTLSFLFTIREK